MANNFVLVPKDVQVRPLKPVSANLNGTKNVGEWIKEEKLTVLVIKNNANNANPIYVGDIAEQSFPLQPGESFTFQCVDPRDIYITANGEQVHIWGFVEVEQK